MGFGFRRDEPVADGAARVASRQLDKAIASLSDPDQDGPRTTVHGVRKRIKRVRAVARLVRSGTGKGYAKVNGPARDAAHRLSAARDADALLATFDALVAAAGTDRTTTDLLPVREGLARRADAPHEIDVERAVELLTAARRGVEGWAFTDGPAVLAEGFDTTYRRGRDGFRSALAEPTPEHLHEWRKATKHLWHQTQLVQGAAPSSLPGQAHAFHALADTLGDDHDLAVLIHLLRDDPGAFGGSTPVDAAVALAEARRADLEDRALRSGARLYVEKPSAFVARMTGLWASWIDLGDELPTGEISDIADLRDRDR